MPKAVKLTWRGRQVQEQVEAATIAGMTETLEACVSVAKANAPVLTGRLRADIDYDPPYFSGNRIVGKWGNYKDPLVHYAFWQENGWAGHPGRFYLRQAQDQEYPKTAARIKAHLHDANTRSSSGVEIAYLGPDLQ